MPRRSASTHLLLLSDTHGKLHPAILALASEVNWIVHAGDVGHPVVLDSLAKTGAGLLAIRGNNDTTARWPQDDRVQLGRLSDTGSLSLPGGELVVEHGHRANPVARRHVILRKRYPTARLVVYGHSHRQLIDDTAEPWIVNPGAAGRSRTFGGAGAILLAATDTVWTLQAHQFALADWK